MKQRGHHRTSKHGKTFPVNQGIIKGLKPLKNKDYKNLMKKVAPFVDADGDGVRNFEDAKPFDKSKK